MCGKGQLICAPFHQLGTEEVLLLCVKWPPQWALGLVLSYVCNLSPTACHCGVEITCGCWDWTCRCRGGAHRAGTCRCACWGRTRDVFTDLELAHPDHIHRIMFSLWQHGWFNKWIILLLSVVSIILSFHSLKNIDSQLTVILWELLASRTMKKIFVLGGGA